MFIGIVFLCLAFLHVAPPEILGQSPDRSPKFPPGGPKADGSWGLSALHTAKNAGYLKDLEKQVILELNKVRSDPPRYARAFLFPQRQYYVGQKLVYPGEVPILTKEGVKAFDEGYQALLKAGSASLLTPKEGLARAARDHALDQGKSGQTGHTGRDHSDVSARANRYGKWGGKIGENIQYGHAPAARIVSSLLIDDGVPSRGHRRIILEPLFRHTGVAFGPHPKFRYMCVLVFAAEYSEGGSGNAPKKVNP
jgi:uncharacterized protein YkwD